jgi:uncharacterized repeat protein (TIGR03803 family)
LGVLMQMLWAAVILLPAFGASGGAVVTSLYSFQVFSNGSVPVAALALGSDGNFYGTASEGGTNGGNGTVYKISTDGTPTSLYSFTGGNDGGTPKAGVVQGSDGYFYGTTSSGGDTNGGFGTVYKISTNGTLSTLYVFGSITNSAGVALDGATPEAGLLLGSNGYFYGTTSGGGTNQSGTVFKISTNGTLTTLYTFTGGDDGGTPSAGLALGSDGYFYGTTSGGGAYTNRFGQRFGTVFKISTNETLSTLYSFGLITNFAGVPLDGATPEAGLLLGSDGYFYGTTYAGGVGGFGSPGSGTVFRISTNGALTNLYSFSGGNDGANPSAGLVEGSDGYFYGTTSGGGTNGDGTVFQISASGALSALYSFGTVTNATAQPVDGADPVAGLVKGSNGMFYGTTSGGGAYASRFGQPLGTVFQIGTNGALTSLYSFNGVNDGAIPSAGLALGRDGNLYGTTSEGGTNGPFYGPSAGGYGTVFQASTNGALITLYDFGFTTNSIGALPGGVNPEAGLVQGSDGYFYGTTESGGTNGYGTVFKISTDGALTTLYSFTGGDDGAAPLAGLAPGGGGYFYGTTSGGGTNGDGTVFQISTNGTLSTLYAFGSITNFADVPLDGATPGAGLVMGSDGYLYGTTESGGDQPNIGYIYGAGTVFRISTNGSLTNLYSFNGSDGAKPLAGLVEGSDGYFYGTTFAGGGFYNAGSVFKISTNGNLTNVYSFTGQTDGAFPVAGLVQGADGNFYGTTPYGGLYNTVNGGYGTVFQMTTNGELTNLYSFTGGNDGGNPEAGLVQGGNGNFYGTTSAYGAGNAGTIFRLQVSAAATAVLNWATPAAVIYGIALSSDQLDATANVQGSFAYTPTNGSVPNAGTNTLTVVFTPTDTVDYSSLTDTVSLVVSPVPLTVTAASVSRVFGHANPVLTGTIIGLTNGDNITATYSTTATTTSPVTTYPVVPRLVDPGNRQTNYMVSLIEGTLTVTQAVPLVTWTTPASITFGTALSSNQLDATASVPGSFAYTPTNGTVLNAGTNTLSVVFTPADTENYIKTTNTVSLVVSSATGTIALYIQLVKNNVILTWNDPTSVLGLQAAPSLKGIFTNIPSAASPYTNIVTGTNQFFRLMAN